MSIKPWYLSRTIWVNALTLLLGILTLLAGQEFIPPRWVAVIIGLIVPVLNLILRWLTDKPISSVHRAFDKLRVMGASTPKK